uniref:Uncharacterized protein n=1 Tax=Rhizophora mucronata TaxID=61149 RepID=A0A2P2R090_RHIMU
MHQKIIKPEAAKANLACQKLLKIRVPDPEKSA